MKKDDYSSLFTRSKRTAAFFEPIFPPQNSPAATTYFGGRPKLPEHIPWPSADIHVGPWGKKKVVHVSANFMAQIDLNDLPAGACGELPKSGTLFFFAITDNDALMYGTGDPGKIGEDPAFCPVVYYEGSTADVPERVEPQDTIICYGEAWDYRYTWREKTTRYGFLPPKSFFKFDVRASAFETEDILYQGPILASRKDSGSDAEGALRAASFEAVKPIANYYSENISRDHSGNVWSLLCKNLPKSVPAHWFSKDLIAALDRDGDDKLIWKGDQGFPYVWSDVEVFCGLLLQKILKNKKKNALSFIHRKGRLEKDIVEWLWKCKTTGIYERVSAEDRNQFRHWASGISDIIQREGTSSDLNCFDVSRCMAASVRSGPLQAVAMVGDYTDKIPATWLENQRWQWSAVTDRDVCQHLMLPHRDGHPFSNYPQHVRLLLLSSQDCFGWNWANMPGIEFWIANDDLASNEFTNCFVRYAPE